jgi:hypothetical protein
MTEGVSLPTKYNRTLLKVPINRWLTFCWLMKVLSWSTGYSRVLDVFKWFNGPAKFVCVCVCVRVCVCVCVCVRVCVCQSQDDLDESNLKLSHRVFLLCSHAGHQGLIANCYNGANILWLIFQQGSGWMCQRPDWAHHCTVRLVLLLSVCLFTEEHVESQKKATFFFLMLGAFIKVSVSWCIIVPRLLHTAPISLGYQPFKVDLSGSDHRILWRWPYWVKYLSSFASKNILPQSSLVNTATKSQLWLNPAHLHNWSS